MPAQPEDYAIVVGIDDYLKPPFGQLHGAKRDAQDFIAWLKSLTGGGLPDKNVDPFTILSDTRGLAPNIGHLFSLLADIMKCAKPGNSRVGRRLYVFLSGHGISPMQLDEAGLVAVDARDSFTPYLPGKDSADFMCLTARFDEVLLFMDCCRLTDMLLSRCTLPFAEKLDPAAAGTVRRFYAFATALDKTAREVMHNGVVRGVFTRVLLDGLQGAAHPNPAGQLTTTQLRTYLEDEMNKIILDGEPLTPKFSVSEEIVLAEDRPVVSAIIHLKLTQPPADLEVLDGGTLALVPLGRLREMPQELCFTLPSDRPYLLRDKRTGRAITLKTDEAVKHAEL